MGGGSPYVGEMSIYPLGRGLCLCSLSLHDPHGEGFKSPGVALSSAKHWDSFAYLCFIDNFSLFVQQSLHTEFSHVNVEVFRFYSF